MFVIEVIPLMKATGLESLTYYSSIEYSLGTIVEVPIRKKQQPAMVVHSEPVSSAKTAVRRATFSLRKLPADTPTTQLSPILIETAKKLQSSVPATLGAILFSLLPKEVREGTATMMSSLPCLGTFETPAVSVLQATNDERYRIYRSKIRSAFAHSGSVLFVVPTSAALDAAVESLSHGIKERVVVLSSANTPKRNTNAYEKFHDLTQAKLIITTPSHAFLDRHDITHIIIEQSRSTHYKSRTRPYIDTREALEIMAKITNRHVVMGDLLPRTEEEYKRHEDIYQTEGEHPKRLVFSSALTYIEQDTSKEIGRNFTLLSPQLLEAMKETLAARKNIFLYAARRGIAPLITCVDCGHVFRCPESGAPYSLVRTERDGTEERWFLCPVSGVRVRAADTCDNCGSWRLTERGIGIQQIEDVLKEQFKDIPLTMFDHTTVKTHRQAKQRIGAFYDQKGAILLGTAMALPYLSENVDRSVITSLDAARTIPTWRADEELLSLLLRLREISDEEVLVQTRTPVDELLQNAKKGTVDQFYTDECELRATLSYPPFANIIHLTFGGTSVDVQETEEAIQTALQPYEIAFYSPLTQHPDKVIRYGLMRIDTTKWPDDTLMERLRSLPPTVRIEVNPHRLI